MYPTPAPSPVQDEDISLSLPELLTVPSGIVTVVCECLAVAAMLPFVVIELGSMQAYAGGWLSLWNGLDVLTYSLQVGGVGDRDGHTKTVIVLKGAL